jgi:N-acetylmuramoyl-L-alanine amidase
VVLDPGHGGAEVGAANHGVVEKASNLDMAFRVERLLQAAGVRVVLTRREDRRVGQQPAAAGPSPSPGELATPAPEGGFSSTRFDLQARVDMANAEQADLFVSIHSNGSPSPAESGMEVWYDPNREFGDQNRQLATDIQNSVLGELSAFGYAAVDRGIKDDTCFRNRNGRCFTLFLLGPARIVRRQELVARGLDPAAFGFREGQETASTRATNMPGVLVELLFISNAADAAVLRDEAGREAMARGIASALLATLDARSG